MDNYKSKINDVLNSDSPVTKFLFLIIALVIFVAIGRFLLAILAFIFRPNPDPWLIWGLIDSTEERVIRQNPRSSDLDEMPGYANDKNRITLIRSNNQDLGEVFSYSMWFYINTLGDSNTLIPVLVKGNFQIDQNTGLNWPSNGPGIYFGNPPNSGTRGQDNVLRIVMNSFHKIDEQVVVKDIPMKKWVCLVLRVSQNNVDVYINGKIKKRLVLDTPVRQNYEDVFINYGNNKWHGHLSNIRYYNYYLNLSQIKAIFNNGPNLKRSENDALVKNAPPYLSIRYFFGGQGDMYNPGDAN